MKSAILPLAIQKSIVSAEHAGTAANLELQLQWEQWGEIPESHHLQNAMMMRNVSIGSMLLDSN